MANSWFRLWTDMVNDPKWRTIARISKQKVGDVIAVYVHMMTMAANASERGRAEGFNDEDVATALDIETEQVTAIRGAMQGRVLDADYLTGWGKRQPLREDGAAERAKAFRERKKAGNEREKTEANATERQKREDEIRKEETGKTTTDASAPSGGGDLPDGPDDIDPPKAAPLPQRQDLPPPVSPAAAIAVALRPLGVGATSMHPTVLAWADRSVSIEVLVEAVRIAREHKGDETIPPQYLAPIVDRLLNPPADRRATSRSSASSQKFHFAEVDRSADVAMMQAQLAARGVTQADLDDDSPL